MVRIPLSAVMAVAAIALLGATGASLSGCVVAAAGSAGVTGYAVLAEDLSSEQQLRDLRIKAEVVGSWGNFNQEMAHRLDATVFDGQVLITGRVPDRGWHDEAVRRTWRVGGVRRVFDEIKFGPDTHFIDSARDTWITTQLRGELIGDIDIKSINYSIITNDGVVYLLGVARTQSEADRVTNHARTVAGVRRVTSFIYLLGAPNGGPQPPPYEQLNAPPPADEGPGPNSDMNDDRDMDRNAPPPPPPPASNDGGYRDNDGSYSGGGGNGGGGSIKAEPLGPQ